MGYWAIAEDVICYITCFIYYQVIYYYIIYFNIILYLDKTCLLHTIQKELKAYNKL